MIRPEELRSGNYFFHNGEIVSLSLAAIGYFADSIDELSGVPLNSQLAEQLGFYYVKKGSGETGAVYRKNHNYLTYQIEINDWLDENESIDGRLRPMRGSMGIYFKAEKNVPAPTNKDPYATIDLEEHMSNFAFYIKYVHQLQNIWFDLTGEVLALTQPTSHHSQ